MLFQGRLSIEATKDSLEETEISVKALSPLQSLLIRIRTSRCCCCLLNPNVNLDVPFSIGLAFIGGSTTDQ